MSFVTEVKEEIVKLSAFERAVVAKRVIIVAVVTAIVQLAVNYGWFDINVSNEILHWLNVALDGLAALVAIGVTQPAVTPVKDPRNDAGTALIPVSQVEAIKANAVSEALAAAGAVPAPAVTEPVEVDDSDDETVEEELPADQA